MTRQLLLLILLAVCLYAQPATAQDKWAGLGIEGNFIAGKIFPHTPRFPKQLPDMVKGYEINALFQTYGKKNWHGRRNYPLVGFGFMFTDYGVDSVYGKCLAIYPNLQLPILHYKDFEWTFKASFGLGYVTRAYERAPSFDTFNRAIGSGFNNFSLFSTDFRYRVNQHLDVQVGGSFFHVSNAAFRTPNLGINTYGAHLGLRYFPYGSQPERIQRDIEPLKNRWLAQVRLGFAAREALAPDGPMYPIYIVSAFASKRYWSKNKAMIGLDYSYHTNMYTFLRNNEIHPGDEKANSWKSAIIVGNEFLYGRVGVLLQLGFYVKNYYIPEDFLYQKLGGNLYLVQEEHGVLKELSLSILLKTHKFEAELVEVGIGAGF